MCVCVLCRGSDCIQPVGLAVPVDGWTHPSPAERARAGARLDDDSAPTVGFAFCMLHRILCCLLLRDRCAPGAITCACLPACMAVSLPHLCGCVRVLLQLPRQLLQEKTRRQAQSCVEKLTRAKAFGRRQQQQSSSCKEKLREIRSLLGLAE